MSQIVSNLDEFITTVEVVPPVGSDPEKLLKKLAKVSNLAFRAFSVASNPVAKPKMSALAFANLLQKHTGKPSILHLTTRDQNLLGLQSELWGAKALGIDTVIAVTGDPSAIRSKSDITTVGDLSVFELISMVKNSGMEAGAVLDFRPEVNGLSNEAKRLEKKVQAGSSFVVTQPVYDEQTATEIYKATKDLNVIVIMGILPLLSYRHAVFLHDKVAGIAIPNQLRKQLHDATDPVEQGILNSRQMLRMAKSLFSGACIMPPFKRFDMLAAVLD